MPRHTTRSNSFFGRSYLVAMTSLAVLIFALVQVGIVMSLKTPQAPAAQPALQKVDYSDQLQAARGKAEQYLVQQLKTMQPSDQLFLDYLYRTYKTPLAFSALQTRIDPRKETTIPKSEMQAVMKMAYPDQKLKLLPSDASLLSRAMQCNAVGLPLDFDQQLSTTIDQGGYATTHALIALKILTEQSCDVPDNSDALIEKGIAISQTVAEDLSQIPDLRYESMAVLALFGRTNQISTSAVEQLLREQNSDGGWPYAYDTLVSKNHSTMLALWAIYALLDPSPANNQIMAQS